MSCTIKPLYDILIMVILTNYDLSANLNLLENLVCWWPRLCIILLSTSASISTGHALEL